MLKDDTQICATFHIFVGDIDFQYWNQQVMGIEDTHKKCGQQYCNSDVSVCLSGRTGSYTGDECSLCINLGQLYSKKM